MKTIVSLAALVAVTGTASFADAPTNPVMADIYAMPGGVHYSGQFELGMESTEGSRGHMLGTQIGNSDQGIYISRDLDLFFDASTYFRGYHAGFSGTLENGSSLTDEQVYIAGDHGTLRYGRVDEAREAALRDPDLVASVTSSDVLDQHSEWDPMRSDDSMTAEDTNNSVVRWDSAWRGLVYSASARIQHGECDRRIEIDEQFQHVTRSCEPQGAELSLAGSYPFHVNDADLVLGASYSKQNDQRDLTLQAEVYFENHTYMIARHDEYRADGYSYDFEATWGDDFTYELEENFYDIKKARSEVAIGYDDGTRQIALHGVKQHGVKSLGVAGSYTVVGGLELTASAGRVSFDDNWGSKAGETETNYGTGLRMKF